MAINLPRSTPNAAPRTALGYQGAPAPNTYSRTNIRAPSAGTTSGQALGESLVRGGERLYESRERERAKEATLETAKAKSYFLRENLRIQSELEQDPDYANYGKKYDEFSGKAYQNAMGMVQDPEARALLEYDLKDSGARTAASVKSLSHQKSIAARTGLFEETLQESMDNALNAKDASSRKQAEDTAGEAIIAAYREGIIDQGGMAKATRKYREEYGEKWALVQEPEVLLGAMTKARTTATPEDIIRSTIEIEGGYNASDGASKAPVIYGINRKYFEKEFEEAKKITEEKGVEAGKKYAEGFYKKEFYDRYDIGRFTPDVQSVLFDGVINHYPGFNKKLISAAVKGAKASDLLEMRREEYNRLGKSAAYAPSLKGWMNRLDKVQGLAGKTGTPLDYLPVEKRVKLRSDSVDALQSLEPVSFLNALNAGAYDDILTPKEVAQKKTDAASSIKKASDQAILQRGMDYLQANAAAMQKFNAGEMTFSELNKLVDLGGINPDFAEEMKRSLVSPSVMSEDPDPSAIVEFYARKEGLKKGARTDEDLLKEAARLQIDVLKSEDLSPKEKQALMKSIQMDMAKTLKAGTDDENLIPDDHYGQAIKEFQSSGANPADVNRMFREYVAQADAQDLDAEVDGGGALDVKHWFFNTEGENERDKKIKGVVKGILAREAGKKYEGLTLLPEAPNAVIGRDGSGIVLSGGKTAGKSDSAVKAPFKIMQDAKGNRARVYEDGRIEEIK